MILYALSMPGDAPAAARWLIRRSWQTVPGVQTPSWADWPHLLQVDLTGDPLCESPVSVDRMGLKPYIFGTNEKNEVVYGAR